MRRVQGQVGRILLGVITLVGAAALGGCGMTPRDQFFQARSITFKSAPGQPGATATGRTASAPSELAAAFGATP